jgi:hypothetical protein
MRAARLASQNLRQGKRDPSSTTSPTAKCQREEDQRRSLAETSTRAPVTVTGSDLESCQSFKKGTRCSQFANSMDNYVTRTEYASFTAQRDAILIRTLHLRVDVPSSHLISSHK